jgi:hypothetical protein
MTLDEAPWTRKSMGMILRWFWRTAWLSVVGLVRTRAGDWCGPAGSNLIQSVMFVAYMGLVVVVCPNTMK